MKKLRLLLALFVASIGAMQSASARTAPTLPEAQAPADGQYYYLYNVTEGKFLCKSSTDWDYAGLGTYGDKILLSATEESNGYTIKWADNENAFMAYDTYIRSLHYPWSYYDYFIFSESSKGYTIQRSSMNTDYYKSDEFIGFDGSNGDRLSPALAEGSIYWQFFTVADAEYYFAKHKLFTYLNVADQYNFYITQYEQIYDNPASTTAELDQAQATLKDALDMSNNYVSPSWSEYPILFQNTTENKWTLNYYKTALEWNLFVEPGYEGSSTLSAIVDVDNDATLVYTYNGGTLRVYLDGELVQDITQSGRREYIEIGPGKHEIRWICLINWGEDYTTWWSNSLSEIGVINSPTIMPATTTVEGQLGTEVLKVIYPESASSVKKIKINGIIGDDDWTTIGLMTNALSIDMSGATATKIPAYMFTKDKYPFLHNVKLPQGIISIEEYAFDGSDVENEITFPESLTSICYRAFHNTKIKTAYIPEGITYIGDGVFYQCYWLKNVTYPASAATIPQLCFCDCHNLRTFTIPEGITEIGRNAFSECWQFNPRFPSTITSIGESAFSSTATDELIINDNVWVGRYAFYNCSNLTYAEWPTTFVSADWNTSPVVNSCPKLTTVKLKSPTVVTPNGDFLAGNDLGSITLQVPDFLEFAYRLDPYWYQCNVEGYNSADQKDWCLINSLVLNEGQRIGGTPNIDMQRQSTLTFNGDTPQTLGDLSFCRDWYCGDGWSTMLLSNTNNVNISGKLTYRAYTPEKRWAFFCLPFDTKVGDITSEASYAIRYYDGAQRANNGTGGNWKNYEADDIIPAGTGFILQTSKQCSTWFTAQDNASKNYVVSNNEFVKALEANPSEVTANKGWNLVGNPWPTYYNIHKLNFTAPITVWNGDGYNSNYVAYSIIDDDYAIKPLEAIFVQCPDEVNSISFPIDGRQLDDVIDSQNAARAAAQSERKLIDVVLSNYKMSDKTRFVMNPQASMDYEVSCDASKFMSMDTNVPQIWTIENGVQMAINERPLDNGTVQIGFKVAQGGEYTISAPRNGFKNIVLVDNETGIETDLSNVDSYTFSTDTGTNEGRFVLRLGSTIVTEVKTLNAELSTPNEYYNLNGQRIAAPQKGLYIVNGKKVMK